MFLSDQLLSTTYLGNSASVYKQKNCSSAVDQISYDKLQFLSLLCFRILVK